MTVYDEIRQERARLRHGEGFGDEHDDQHTDGSLARAAACYATGIVESPPWPRSWDPSWDKREEHPRRRQLIIAAALIVAEVERLDRAVNRAEPVCATCEDTHRMSLHNDDEEERIVMCTRCPSPCEKCREGAYCATTPCACECHRQAPSSERRPETEDWAIVELYGHRLAGQVSPAAFPEGFVRIDTVQGVTQVYSPKAIFSLTWVTERAARSAAPGCDDPAPIKPWENRQEERLGALRRALGRIARGEVSPAIDLARETLAADDKLRPDGAQGDDSTGEEDWP